MRLIDADIMEKQLGKFVTKNLGEIKASDIKKFIQEQLTAYDVDKVVEVLKKYRINKFLTIANTGNTELDKEYEIIGKTLDFVTEAVKKGVIE